MDAIILSEVRTISKDLSGSRLLPTPLQGKPSDVLAIVLAGRELGLGPMTAVRGIDIIQGKLSLSSALIGALIQSSPACEYLTPIESSPTRATYETKRKGSPKAVTMSFTIEEARAAGLASKDNYRKNPTAMLLARAQARIGRACYPDVMLGIYDKDSGELEDLEKEVNPAPLAQHVEDTKSKLREAVSGGTKPAGGDVVEGTLVESKPAEPPKQPDIVDRVMAAKTKEELIALKPELVPLGQMGKSLFEKRKAEIIALAKGGGQ